jgi:O-antigen ligase
MYSNLIVAQENVKNNPLTGSGLGGNEETYYRLYSNSPFRLNYYYGLNAKSAHSLTIRIISELGILGFLLYLFTLIKNLFLMDRGVFRAISLACLSHFLCKTFKLGGIIDYGTPFFFAMLIINGLNYHYNKNKYA